MNYFDEAAAQVAYLGEYTGNSACILDKNGRAMAEIEGIRFSFFYEAEYSALFIQAALGAPGQGALEALMLRNHLWEGTAGGVFGVNSEDGILYYSYRLDFPVVTGATGAEEGVYPVFLCDLMAYIVGAIEAAMDDITPEPSVQTERFDPLHAV
ncbi:MAG: type III secretion system chaperone [Deltaproteobacteria bacterium]|jgi:hypothetical protein|nr:type III secretion system chaperone [Deltaproteobacteria bacterium]